MTDPARILVFAGSVRKDSLSKKLAKAAGYVIADQGSAPKVIDLKDFEAPLYNGDYETEHGIPDAMKALGKLIAEHDGVVLATPEYNGFFTPLTKNVLDWCSRIGRGTDEAAIKRGTPACIISSSGGALGGLRAVPRLRDYLNELGFLVSPDAASIGKANEAFGADGRLQVESQPERLETVVRSFLKLVDSIRHGG